MPDNCLLEALFLIALLQPHKLPLLGLGKVCCTPKEAEVHDCRWTGRQPCCQQSMNGNFPSVFASHYLHVDIVCEVI